MNTLKTFSPRTVPGYVNVLGSAKTNATVSLWSSNSTSLYATTTRKGECFHRELPLNNTTGAVWLTLTNLAVLNNSGNPDIVTNTIGQIFVAQTPEAFYYDLDGNLTNDGRWVYTWDAENRLERMESSSAAPSPSKLKLEFAYDAKGRRIQKLVSTNNGSSYVAQYTNRFVYDGWNLVGVLSPNSSLLSAFVWGLDLSGSIQGAGGVGGLLLCRDSGTTTNCAAYDGNGNVMALVNAASGAVSAKYEYGPFGEVLRVTGANAKTNPFRFSTKYQDDESDCLYYGYRSYNPSIGRWPNRDPLNEDGGLNPYGFDGNDMINVKDVLGLFKSSSHCNAAELTAIRTAESAASAAASGALIALQTQFKVKNLLSRYPRFKEKWLNDPNFRNDYYAWYRWTESDLKQITSGFAANSYEVQCECNCWERPKGTWAYVDEPSGWFPLNGIHFCPLFFKDAAKSQVKHFLHEASHLFADTDDLALGGTRPWVNNADDAYFYGEIGLGGGHAVFDSFISRFSALYP